MCFADSDQGTVSAQVFNDQYKGKTVGIFFKSDDDYSVGIKNNFVANLDASFGKPVEASFTDATASSFTQQVSELKDCDVIFMPIYYDPAALFMKQGNGIVKANAIYYGCDGLDGIDAVEGFDITSITQGVSYLSHFNSGTTEGAAKKYIDAYVAEYGADAPLNQFGAAAYDCVYAIFEAMKFAIANNGAEITATTAPADLCNILTAVFDSADFKYRGITGAPEADGKSTITWNENGASTNGHVKKTPVSYVVKAADAQ
jgi:branched-chain amino acid transport system substrate-binding protein